MLAERYLGILALLLACLDGRIDATPLIAIQVSGQVILGTNTLDNDGYAACKIFSGPSAVLIKSSHFSRIRRSRDAAVVLDSGDKLWEALRGSPIGVEERVTRAMEAGAKQFVRFHDRSGDKTSKIDYLNSMESHIILVSVLNGIPTLDVFVLQFTDWNAPKATIVRFPTVTGAPSTRVEWWNTGKPQIIGAQTPPRPLDEVTGWLAKLAINNARSPNRSYSGASAIATADAHGIHWAAGEPDACKIERSRFQAAAGATTMNP